jgi:putative flippase GtrA
MKNSLGLLREFLRYGAVSAVALLVDLACLFLLARHVHYLAAASCSFVLGGFIAYYLSVRFVFQRRLIDQAPLEASVFIGLGVVGLMVNGLLIALGTSSWQLSLGSAKLLAAGATFTTNFALRKWLLFSGKGCFPAQLLRMARVLRSIPL